MNYAAPNLVKYDAMCRAIDAAYSVDEAKDIRDKAKAIEVYSRQAKNFEAERRACEIRLRAEKKAGQLRAAEEKINGRPKSGSTTGPLSNPERRKELGISAKQDKQWQKLAKVPDEIFEKALKSKEKPTTNGIIAEAFPPKAKVGPAPSDMALWVWGRLCDFERNGTLKADPQKLLTEMTKQMAADTRRLAPKVAAWLEGISNDA